MLTCFFASARVFFWKGVLALSPVSPPLPPRKNGRAFRSPSASHPSALLLFLEDVPSSPLFAATCASAGSVEPQGFSFRPRWKPCSDGMGRKACSKRASTRRLHGRSPGSTCCAQRAHSSGTLAVDSGRQWGVLATLASRAKTGYRRHTRRDPSSEAVTPTNGAPSRDALPNIARQDGLQASHPARPFFRGGRGTDKQTSQGRPSPQKGVADGLLSWFST